MALCSMRNKVLVLEDNPELAELLEYNLGQGGYDVTVLARISGALDVARESRPDLIILDVMLPDGDGFDLCREVRRDAVIGDTPVLFLTGRAAEVDRVLGLEIGGDDYVTKPFSPRELLARVKAHLRRRTGNSMEPSTGGDSLRIDPGARRVFLNGSQVSVTATEFRLLEFFLANPGRVFTREQLLESIWGKECHVTPRNIDVHVRRLRERLEESPGSPRRIQTVRGFGYRFEQIA